MPRVALVVPFFPPESSGGVFRALKLISRLRDRAWEPVVWTLDNPGTPLDPTLLEELPADLEVHRIPATAAQRLQRGPLRRLGFAFEALGLTATASAQWDALAAQLLAAHRRQPYDLVFSSSPPPSAHRAVLALLDHLPAGSRPPWVADFRDPWRRGFMYSPASDAEAAADVRDESRTFHQAALMTTTTLTSLRASCMEHSLSGEALVWVPNGYDPQDIAGLPSAPRTPAASGIWRIGYAGAMYGPYTIQHFIDGLAVLFRREPALRSRVRIDCYGPRHKPFLQRIAQDDLAGAVAWHGYLGHRAVLEELARCHAVLVAMPHDPRALDTVSGKLYEYLGARMPVLAAASPDGAIAQLLRETLGGQLWPERDATGIADRWAALLATPPGMALLSDPPASFAEFQQRYSRDAIADLFVQTFERALARPPVHSR